MMALSAAFSPSGSCWLSAFSLGQVFVNLLYVFVTFGGRREHARYAKWPEARVIGLVLSLDCPKFLKVFDGVVDRARRQDGVELAPGCSCVVLGDRFARLGLAF